MQIRLLLVLLGVLLALEQVFACDPCSLYSAAKLQGHTPGSFTALISEQYTSFSRPEGQKPNSTKDGEFVRGFSTTQISIARDFSDQFGLQLTLPIVYRRFDQVKNFRVESESESGLGDISIFGSYSILNYRRQDWVILGSVLSGVKFPTGDTGTLGDLAEEGPVESHRTTRTNTIVRHHQISGVSGGRALTIGSGSYDYIFGLSSFLRYQRLLLLSSAQYTVRTEGDFNYEFADDFLFSFGPGYYLLLDHECTTALRLALSGEFKGRDELSGRRVSGSAISNLYLGPEVLASLSDKFSLELGLDFRISDEDSGSTVVPDFKTRASFSYRFS